VLCVDEAFKRVLDLTEMIGEDLALHRGGIGIDASEQAVIPAGVEHRDSLAKKFFNVAKAREQVALVS
jgi:hypothetical protein